MNRAAGELVWDDSNVRHIADHGIATTEVEEICRSPHTWSEARYGRLRVIGRTRAGRVLVAIIDPLEHGRLYCITAFPATGRTLCEYLQHDQGGLP